METSPDGIADAAMFVMGAAAIMCVVSVLWLVLFTRHVRALRTSNDTARELNHALRYMGAFTVPVHGDHVASRNLSTPTPGGITVRAVAREAVDPPVSGDDVIGGDGKKGYGRTWNAVLVHAEAVCNSHVIGRSRAVYIAHGAGADALAHRMVAQLADMALEDADTTARIASRAAAA